MKVVTVVESLDKDVRAIDALFVTCLLESHREKDAKWKVAKLHTHPIPFLTLTLLTLTLPHLKS